MNPKQLRLEAKIGPAVFRRFAVFDTLYRQQRWRAPVLFAAILAVFAGICLSQRGKIEQAGLLGTVLLIIGLGLPCVYFLSFFASVNKRAKQLGKGNATAYTVALKEEGIQVSTPKEQVEYPWEKLFFAYRLRDCICLYADPRRAYLLPLVDGSKENEAFWAFICSHMPIEKQKDRA